MKGARLMLGRWVWYDHDLRSWVRTCDRCGGSGWVRSWDAPMGEPCCEWPTGRRFVSWAAIRRERRARRRYIRAHGRGRVRK